MDERRDDWRHGVDENLASLNAGQRVHDSEISRLWKARSSDDKLLRGDPDKDTDGIIARIHTIENAINLLRAVVDVDKAGNKGLVGRVEALEAREKSTVERWKFWVAIIGLIGAVIVSVITNLDKIERFVAPPKKPDRLHQMIDKAKHPRGRPIVRYRIVPPAEQEPDEEEKPE